MATKDPREPFTRISPAEAKEMIENGGAQVIDVREGFEFQTGHVPGAANIPVSAVFPRRAELASDRDLVFICAVGQRSALGCEMAAAAGLTRLFNVEGGTEAWVKEGFPVES